MVQRRTETEPGTMVARMWSPAAPTQPPVSAAVTVRTVPAGAVSGSTATPRSRLRTPEVAARTPTPGVTRLVSTSVGAGVFTRLPEQVWTLTAHRSFTGST